MYNTRVNSQHSRVATQNRVKCVDCVARKYEIAGFVPELKKCMLHVCIRPICVDTNLHDAVVMFA